MDTIVGAEAELLANVLGSIKTTSKDANTGNSPVDRSLVIECVKNGCCSVLSKMCNVEIAPAGSSQGCAIGRHQLSGVIDINGPFRVTVVVNLSTELAFHASEALVGVRATAVDADVIDLVGELANMIVGQAKKDLNNDLFSLGFPTVVSGAGHNVVFQKDMELSVIRFASNVGQLQLEIGFGPGS